MRAIRLLAVLLLLPLPALAAADDDDDWKLIGGALALVQQIVHQAATSPDQDAAQRGVDAVLSGQNAQANLLAARILADVLQDLPPAERALFVSIGRDLLVLARREQERQRGSAAPAPAEPARNPPPAR